MPRIKNPKKGRHYVTERRPRSGPHAGKVVYDVQRFDHWWDFPGMGKCPVWTGKGSFLDEAEAQAEARALNGEEV